MFAIAAITHHRCLRAYIIIAQEDAAQEADEISRLPT
jgi:hypothetical protein